MVRALDVFRMPTPVGVMGRSSSITNSFINGIIPARQPTQGDVAEALRILEISPDDFRCCYCGDRATEWDHLRPLIIGQEPTGFISEIQNLVPSCGKCNQSKGNSPWEVWLRGNARLCPRVRGVADLETRVARLKRFEQWREPTKLDIPALVGAELWSEYRANWQELLNAMRKSQELAVALKQKLRELVGANAPRPQIASLEPTCPGRTPKILSSSQMPADERRMLIGRVREWAAKPHLNVHKIISVVVRAGGRISRDQLVREAERVTRSKNAYGAVSSLLTSKANAYGRVFADVGGTIHLHPDLEREVLSCRWS